MRSTRSIKISNLLIFIEIKLALYYFYIFTLLNWHENPLNKAKVHGVVRFDSRYGDSSAICEVTNLHLISERTRNLIIQIYLLLLLNKLKLLVVLL